MEFLSWSRFRATAGLVKASGGHLIKVTIISYLHLMILLNSQFHFISRLKCNYIINIYNIFNKLVVLNCVYIKINQLLRVLSVSIYSDIKNKSKIHCIN